jgi:hypothetical protein
MESLSAFRRVERITDCAALQLHPPNFDRIAALEALAARAVECEDGTRKTSARAWTRWLSSDEARPILAVEPEGIIDRPIVEAVAVAGMPLAVLVGCTGDEAIAARLLVDALDSEIGARPDDAALRSISVGLRATLALGHEMVMRAGLDEAQWPQHADKRILVPDTTALRRLREAVTFDCDQLALEALAPLISNEPSGQTGLCPRRPLLRDGERVIVARPFALVSVALAQAWRTLAETEAGERVTATITARWRREVTELVAFCDWKLAPERGRPDTLGVELDGGTFATVVLLVEQPPALMDAASADAGSVWDASALVRDVLASLVVRDGEQLFVVFARLGFGRATRISVHEDSGHAYEWVIDAQALQYLLEASRLDPLALVRAHRLLGGRELPPPSSAELLDLVGAARFVEDTGTLLPEGADPTEIVVRLARANAGRMLAPSWVEPDHHVEVVRFRYSNDERFFTPALGDGHERLLLARGDTLVWISSANPTASRYQAEAVLTVMVAFWVGRLANVNLIEDDGHPIWRSLRVLFDPSHGHDVSADINGGRPQLSFGPAFLALAARGDNRADRALVSVLLGALSAPADAPAQDLLAEVLDVVAPAGPGTFILWNDPASFEVPPPPRELVRTSAWERRQVAGALAQALRARGHVGVVDGPEAKGWLDLAVEAGLRLLESEIAKAGPELLEELVGLSEIAAREAEQLSVQHAAYAALCGLPSGGELIDEWVAEPARARTAIRFLVEFAHARRPLGERRVNRELLGRLRALSETVLEAASISDAVHSRLLELKLGVAECSPLALVASGPSVVAREDQWKLTLGEAPEASVEMNPLWWDADGPAEELNLDRAVELSDRWAAVSDAMSEEIGFSFDALLRVTRGLADFALDAGMMRLPRPAVIATAAETTSLAPPECAAVVDFLTRKRPDNYDPRKHPHKPWKAGRPQSYLRQPLLCDEDELLWSSGHLLLALGEIVQRMELARLALGGRRTQRALGQLRAEGDRNWERELLGRLMQAGLPVRGRIETIGGRPIVREDGSTLGDVDVLALDEQARTIWALDAKRVVSSSTPLGLLDEAEQLRKEAAKHARRVAWLDENRAAVAREFACDDPLSDWRLKGALVIAAPLGGATVAQGTIAILTWPQLRALLAGGSAGAAAGSGSGG